MTELNMDFDETDSRNETGYGINKIVKTSERYEEMIRTKLKQTLGIAVPKNNFNESVIRSKYFSELKDEDKINIMVTLNIKLALRVANFYVNYASFNHSHLLDEYASLAYFGLLKAAHSFDLDRKVKFSSYAGKCMHNEIRMFIRKEKSRRQPLYLDDVVLVKKRGRTLEINTFLETLEGENNIEDFLKDIDKKLINDELYDFLQTLSEIEINVLTERFGLRDDREKSQSEIAEILDRKRPSISKIEKRAVSKLRAYYFKKYNIKPTTLKLRSKVVRRKKKE